MSVGRVCWLCGSLTSLLDPKLMFLGILTCSCQTLVNTRQLKHLVHVNIKVLKDWNLETLDDDDDYDDDDDDDDDEF